jgi:hypothetical protein
MEVRMVLEDLAPGVENHSGTEPLGVDRDGGE